LRINEQKAGEPTEAERSPKSAFCRNIDWPSQFSEQQLKNYIMKSSNFAIASKTITDIDALAR
jgi:hypothetical protein